MNIVAKKIQATFQHYLESVTVFTKKKEIPVVLIGGGTNIPILTEAIEQTATGKVFWWGEAEEAIVVGTAMGFQSKTPPVEDLKNEDQLSNHFYQLFLKAETGDAESQYYVGKSLELGHGTPISPEEAFDWYGLAAENGSTKAKHRLAILPFNSLGTIRSAETSLKFLREFAEAGDALLQFYLGRYLHENENEINNNNNKANATKAEITKTEITEAEMWLRRAAQQNVSDAVAYCKNYFDQT
jgi:TPR repeat protein